ncbi:DUF4334 domain-containing protein [Streptomyces sp. NBC_00539]
MKPVVPHGLEGIEFPNEITAAMVYDRLQVMDHFKRVTTKHSWESWARQ